MIRVNMNIRTAISGLLIFFLMVNMIPVASFSIQPKTEEDVYSYIRDTLVVSYQTKENLIQALTKGFGEGRISTDSIFIFLRKVHTSGAAVSVREDILLTIVETLKAGLPVTQMLRKVHEGLRKGKSLGIVVAVLRNWQSTLYEVNELLREKGIHVGVKLLPQNKPLPIYTLDLLIESISDVLEQYVSSEKDPTQKGTVERAVIARLEQLERSDIIPSALVKLVKNRISPEELSEISLSIKKRKTS